jgi:hypothetical protein
MKYTHFYATGADILPVLRRLEQDHLVKYIPTGKRSEINRPIYLTWREIPNPGISTNETGFLSIAYMVSPRNIKNVIYAFTDKKGQKSWLLSNGDNPDSVILTMAGLWTTGTLLPGNMRTLHDTPNAQRIMKTFRAAVKAESFVKYDVYWFGREAIDMLQAGRRLVEAEQSPRSFDIPRRQHWDPSEI